MVDACRPKTGVRSAAQAALDDLELTALSRLQIETSTENLGASVVCRTTHLRILLASAVLAFFGLDRPALRHPWARRTGGAS